jgi:hypothetical protein
VPIVEFALLRFRKAAIGSFSKSLNLLLSKLSQFFQELFAITQEFHGLPLAKPSDLIQVTYSRMAGIPARLALVFDVEHNLKPLNGP